MFWDEMAAKGKRDSRIHRPGRGGEFFSFLEQHRMLRVVGIAAGSALLAVVLGWTDILERAELSTYDLRVRTMAPGGQSDLVVVVDYDQYTVERYAEQWGRLGYWPRSIHKAVLEHLARGNPKVVAYDFIFSFGADADDEEFAEKCGALGNVVHACVLFDSVLGEDAAKAHPAPPQVLCRKLALGAERAPFQQLSGATWPYRATPPDMEVGLLEKATAVGSIHLEKDLDSIARRVSPGVNHAGYLWPALSTAVAMSYLGERPSFSPGEMRIGKRRMLLDAKGRRLLKWYGPGKKHRKGDQRRYKALIVGDLIEAEKLIRAGKSKDIPAGVAVEPGSLEGKIVLVATGAAGAYDLRQTPFGYEPGVYVHAAAIESLIRGESVWRAGGWWSAGIALLLGLLVAISFPGSGWRAVLRGSLAYVVVAGGFAILSFVLYSRANTWIALIVPQMAAGASLAGSLLAGYLVEGRRARRLRRGMSRFLSPEVLAEVADDLDNLRPGMGKRREVSMMFCDVRNFTTMSEKLEPEAVMEILGVYLGSMTDVIMDNGGTLSKYLGDGIMAFWGAPLEIPDHTERAARAALDMIAAQEEVKKQLAADGKPTFDIGIGLHSGDAVIGTVGSERRLEYTAIGDTVNLASRVESLTKEFKVRICVTSDFSRGLRDKFEFKELGSVRVKGRSAEVKVFELGEKPQKSEDEA
jgi:adenylate cyclase